MQYGLADYAHKAAATDSLYVETVDEYNLYCHYVAGLVGEGLPQPRGACAPTGPQRPVGIGQEAVVHGLTIARLPSAT